MLLVPSIRTHQISHQKVLQLHLAHSCDMLAAWRHQPSCRFSLVKKTIPDDLLYTRAVSFPQKPINAHCYLRDLSFACSSTLRRSNSWRLLEYKSIAPMPHRACPTIASHLQLRSRHRAQQPTIAMPRGKSFATRTTVNQIFTMACTTYSWNNSAARRVPHSAFFNNHTTPCSSASQPENPPRCRRPVMRGRTPPTHRGYYTVCLFDLCAVWLQNSTQVEHQSTHVFLQSNPFVFPMLPARPPAWISQKPIHLRFACIRPTTRGTLSYAVC